MAKMNKYYAKAYLRNPAASIDCVVEKFVAVAVSQADAEKMYEQTDLPKKKERLWGHYTLFVIVDNEGPAGRYEEPGLEVVDRFPYEAENE